MLKRTILSIVLLAPALSQAAVYQCKVNGQTVFSDQPCGDDAKEINIKPPARNGSGMVSDGARDFLEHRDRKAKIERISRDIDRLEREKAQVRRKMDDALDRYQQQKSLANNNLAGATWEQALANEAEVMRQRYQSEIDELDDEITRLRDDQRRLVDQNE